MVNNTIEANILLAIAAGFALLAFFYLWLSLRKKTLADKNRPRILPNPADTRLRAKNKIQWLFDSEAQSNFNWNKIALPDLIKKMGCVASQESQSENWLTACKAFHPNLIVAPDDCRERIENLVESSALLINTPIVYLRCKKSPVTPNERVRAYLGSKASPAEIEAAISECLKKSPEKIQYSVQPAALKGEIHGTTLMELIYFLSSVKKTGRLQIKSGAVEGEVQFRNGEMINAGHNHASGVKAVEELLDLASGSFELHLKVTILPEENVAAKNETINTEKLLFEWAKKKDESQHHLRA